MGNIIGMLDIMTDNTVENKLKNEVCELKLDNEALKKQVESLKSIIQKEGKIIGNLESANKKLRADYNLEKNNNCIVCQYMKN